MGISRLGRTPVYDPLYGGDSSLPYDPQLAFDRPLAVESRRGRPAAILRTPTALPRYQGEDHGPPDADLDRHLNLPHHLEDMYRATVGHGRHGLSRNGRAGIPRQMPGVHGMRGRVPEEVYENLLDAAKEEEELEAEMLEREMRRVHLGSGLGRHQPRHGRGSTSEDLADLEAQRESAMEDVRLRGVEELERARASEAHRRRQAERAQLELERELQDRDEELRQKELDEEIREHDSVRHRRGKRPRHWHGHGNALDHHDRVLVHAARCHHGNEIVLTESAQRRREAHQRAVEIAQHRHNPAFHGRIPRDHHPLPHHGIHRCQYNPHCPADGTHHVCQRNRMAVRFADADTDADEWTRVTPFDRYPHPYHYSEEDLEFPWEEVYASGDDWPHERLLMPPRGRPSVWWENDE